ncbi:MAG: D-mannonate oxidoreductase [Anaerolineales bacterium]|nr:MAG: D-mannonate oxidoreductase [Anaerolineales bacterium]
MKKNPTQTLFNLSNQVAVVTGGAGILCAAICRYLADQEVKVAILDINRQATDWLANDIIRSGGEAIGVPCDVCDRSSLEAAASQVISTWGKVDMLINGVGGNRPSATTRPDLPFFDISAEALEGVFNLNLMGTILASQVFGRLMTAHKKGTILNLSSMNAYRPLTRIPAYSAAKAAVSNFTQWLAVHMALEYSASIRVNAIAPGFFLTNQNHDLLIDRESGELTERGQSITTHTPMKRFGIPEDLLGAVLWLLSPASSFVTGIVVPVDGGFSAYSGV